MTLAVASKALNASNALLEQFGEDPTVVPEQSHSWVNHWPAATAGLSCLIVTISGIALGILGNPALSVLLGIAAIGCAALAIHLRNYSTSKNLDSYTSVLAEQVTKISRTVCRIDEENKRLAKIEKDFETTERTLRDQLKEQAAMAANVAANLEDKIAKLEADLNEREQLAKNERAEREKLSEKLTRTHAERSQELEERKQLFDKQKAASDEALSLVSVKLQRAQDVKLRIGQILDDLHKRSPTMRAKIKRLASDSAGVSISGKEFSDLLPSIRDIKTEIQKSLESLQQRDEASEAKEKEADVLVVTVCGVAENAIHQLEDRDRKLDALSQRVDTLFKKKQPSSTAAERSLDSAFGSGLVRPRSSSSASREGREGSSAPVVQPTGASRP